MQMIDVMKRLAELDSTNNNVIKANATIKECGPMGMMGSMGGMEKPSTPASMNITAGSGDELAQMLATIMQMSGGKKDSPGEMGAEPGVEIMTAEPEIKVEPMSGGDAMRSMMDKLNPMDDAGEEGGDDVSKSHGDFDNDGDHDMDDHEKEKDDEKETDESYDNSPDPKTEKYGAMSAHGDQTPGGPPGQKDRYDGTSPKAFPTSEARLMAEYKEFVNEAEKQTMSRAAKGHEKYGKKGMQALAKAGRDGKDLDKVRDKYNKYD